MFIGVALAAIQGLYQVVQEKDSQIVDLQTENASQVLRLNDLEIRLANLEKQDNHPGSQPYGLWFTIIFLIVGLVLGRFSVTRKLDL